LEQGIHLVGLTVRRAVTWSARIVDEHGGPKLLIPADKLDEGTAQQVLALLVAERSLIEFCLGPAARRRNGAWEKRQPNDLCSACFLPPWHVDRLPVELVRRLRDRKRRIDRHAAHLTWTPAQHGHRRWTAAALLDVVTAIERIEESLAEAGSPFAEPLRSGLVGVNDELAVLRSSAPMELQPLAVAV
jgi:hypothetical protein